MPGQILEVVDASNRLARVDVAGVQRNVKIGPFDGDGDGGGVGPGDGVLIHVGFATSRSIGRRPARRGVCLRGWARTTNPRT